MEEQEEVITGLEEELRESKAAKINAGVDVIDGDNSVENNAGISEEKEKLKGMLAKVMDKLKASKSNEKSLQEQIDELMSKGEGNADIDDMKNRRLTQLESKAREQEEMTAQYVIKVDDQEKLIRELTQERDNAVRDMTDAALGENSDLQGARDELDQIMAECAVLETFAKNVEILVFPSEPSRLPTAETPPTQAVRTIQTATDRVYGDVSIIIERQTGFPPSQFDIILVCDHGGNSWCLISATRHYKGEDVTAVEWHSVNTVQGWCEETTDVQAISSVQLEHQRQQEELKARIQVLEGEVSGSQQLFDQYRERAKTSLQKTAAEVQGIQKELAKAKEECLTQSKRADDAHKRIGVIENENELVIEDLKARLETKEAQKERAVDELLSTKAELDKALYSKSETHASIANESSKLEEEVKALKRSKEDLEDLNEGLKRKEQKLLTDQKKRSEAARELIESKDKEIVLLKDKIQSITSLDAHTSADGSQAPQAQVNLNASLQGEQEIVDLRAKVIELTSFVNELHTVNDEMKLENDSLKLRDDDLRTKIATLEQRELDASVKSAAANANTIGGSSLDGQGEDRLANPQTPLSKYAASLTAAMKEEDITEDEVGSVGGADDLIQHVSYLRQAFIRFVEARSPIEMQHCGRVICAILTLTGDQHDDVIAKIKRISEHIDYMNQSSDFGLSHIVNGVFSFYS